MFEIIERDRKNVKLTVTTNRVTIKLPIGRFSDEEKKSIEIAVKKAVKELEEQGLRINSLRGYIKENSIALKDKRLVTVFKTSIDLNKQKTITNEKINHH